MTPCLTTKQLNEIKKLERTLQRAAVASFRVAKALARNPGSRDEIASFAWRGSHPFRWNSQQLMELGLMEPGQWF